MKYSAIFYLLIVWTITTDLINAQHHRYKIRRPRPPIYKSKWPIGPPICSTCHHGPRMHISHMKMVGPRPRPNLMYKGPPMFNTHTRPYKQPNLVMYPKPMWNPPTSFKPPINEPFITSQPVTPGYEYQIPQNIILETPMRLDDEKGPIHTIPAPDLSLAEKPIMVNHFKVPIYTKQIYTSPVQQQLVRLPIRTVHQYQVTEIPDSTNDQTIQDPLTGYNKLFAPDPDPSLPAPKLRPTQDPYSIPSNGKPLPVDLYVQSAQQQPIGTSLSSQELYQLLNSFSQQQLTDSYGLPISQQPQLQQHILQQAQGVPIQQITPVTYVQQGGNSQSQLFKQEQQVANSQPQLFKPEPNYINAFPVQQVGFQPQYQTFNYEEQSAASPGQLYAAAQDQNNRLQEVYGLQSQASQIVQTAVPSEESVQYSNNFAESQSDQDKELINNLVNGNQLDSNQNDHNSENQQALGSSYFSQINKPGTNFVNGNYYTSLPSREAAETLATLQAAGSINNNLMNIAKQQMQQQQQQQAANDAALLDAYSARLKEQQEHQIVNHHNEPDPPMRIYVPDDNDNYDDIESQPINEQENIDDNVNNDGFKIYETFEKQNEQSVGADYDDYSQVSNNTHTTEEDPHLKTITISDVRKKPLTTHETLEDNKRPKFGTRI